jgi:hypothetical protein
MSLENKEKLLQFFHKINLSKNNSPAGLVLITMKTGKVIIGKIGDVLFDKENGKGYIVVSDEKLWLNDIQSVQ